MANHKQTLKRIKTNEKARLRNKAVRTNLKTVTKRFYEAVDSGDVAKAQEAYNFAAKRIDMAATKKVIHVNAAARRKHTLALALNQMSK